MRKRLLDTNEFGNTYSKTEGGVTFFETTQDTTDHVRWCNELKKHNDPNSKNRLLADIPMIFIDKWSKELPNGESCLKPKYRKFLKNKINSPEFERFKMVKGKI